MIDENIGQETQGKKEKDNINKDNNQTQLIELVSPKAGTATSSPSSSMCNRIIGFLAMTFRVKQTRIGTSPTWKDLRKERTS
jgi:hypothetical protein